MSEESEERFYDLEDYRMTLEELDELRKQYERLRYGHAVTLRKLEALRNEVKAWRDADEREDMLFNTLGEEDRNRILQAITNTDNTGAMEAKR